MIYNFGAGPACLPQEVLNQIREDIPLWKEGMSVMEVSHRAKTFMDLSASIEDNFRQLLSVPAEFSILFMHGGARGQFSAVPLNLLGEKKSADYIVTGVWSQMAFNEAKKYCQPHCAASSESENFNQIPDEKTWELSSDAAYVHYTDNETVQGVEFPTTPNVNGALLVSDMTSNILSRPIDFSKISLIYASAQKNLGIAGITVVIVRKSLLGKAHPYTPIVLDYTLTNAEKSLANTPPVFTWYVLGLMLDWMKAQGGLPALAKTCDQKANLLYDFIDNSGFYSNPIFKPHRSRVNVPFQMNNPTLEAKFLDEADKNGFKQLKGHKLVGGCRASIYNAMPIAGLKALIEFMQQFQKENG